MKTGISRAHRGYEKDRGKGERGQVREFSQRSRVRLAKVCSSIAWGSFPFLFVTLTYAGEGPADGRSAWCDLDRFRKNWEYRYGAPLGVWKREFQSRGAVHFHLAIGWPGMGSVPLVELQRTVELMWGKGRVGVEELRKPPIAYFSSHGQHGRDKKGYQNEVPEGFRNPGRFWGVWNVAPEWDERRVSPEEWVEARRILRAWAKSKRRRLRPCRGRVQGAWFRTRGFPAYLLMADVMRAVEIAVT